MSVPEEKMKVGSSVRIPMALVPVYVAIFVQFMGVVFMSGVIYSKMNEQGAKLDKFEAKLDKYVEALSTDVWRKNDHAAFEKNLMEHLRDDDGKFESLGGRISYLEKQLIRYHPEAINGVYSNGK